MSRIHLELLLILHCLYLLACFMLGKLPCFRYPLEVVQCLLCRRQMWKKLSSSNHLLSLFESKGLYIKIILLPFLFVRLATLVACLVIMYVIL